MWTPEIRSEIARRCPWQLKAKEYGQVVKALRHLANGTLAMYRLERPVTLRKRRRDTPTEERRQASIDELWSSADNKRSGRKRENVYRYEEQRTEEQQDRGDGVQYNFDNRNYDG
jgi:hypothetical protein